MSTWLLIATHGFTALVTFTLTRWYVTRALERRDARMGTSPAEPPFDRPSTRLIVTTLAASIVIIVIGVQAHYATEDAKDAVSSAKGVATRADTQITCTQDWADQLQTALDSRVTLNDRLRNAEAGRDSAIDGILTVLLKARALGENPTPAEEAALTEEYNAALTTYAEAKATLDQVREDLANATPAEQNAYPVLAEVCADEKYRPNAS